VPNENKMSDGGREPGSLGLDVWKSSQKWTVQESAVRSIVWLGLSLAISKEPVSLYAPPPRPV